MTVAVRKFGGSSLDTVEAIDLAAFRLAEAHLCGRRVVAVVSARGDTTDELAETARQVHPEPPPRELDQLLATGECASAALLAMALQRLGIPAVSLTGAQAGILASGRHGAGVVAGVRPGRIRELLSQGIVVVVAGFQGINEGGDVVTLGRGGSDTTAVALAAELDVATCEIYTDVDGVFTADPRLVANARVLARLDNPVMAELAFAGAQVLHPRAVELAGVHGVSIEVSHCLATGAGTVITAGEPGKALETRPTVLAVAHDLDVVRVHVGGAAMPPELASEVFAWLACYHVPVDMVSVSRSVSGECELGFTARRADLDQFHDGLRGVAAQRQATLRVEKDLGKVSLIGTGLLDRTHHAAHMLSTLARAGIATTGMSTSQLRTCVTIPLAATWDAVRILHRQFELARTPGSVEPPA